MPCAPATKAASGDGVDDIDPLDAYMDSLAGEVTQQAEDSETSLPSTASSRQYLPPSPAQLAISHKVSASPFCNVLPSAATSTTAAPGEATEACLQLLLHQPGEFLSRFGHILTPGDLESLLPSHDPVVALHVVRLKSLMLSQQRRQQQQQGEEVSVSRSTNEDVDMSPATTSTATTATGGSGGEGAGGIDSRGRGNGIESSGVRVRNRRYRRLQQLAEGGVWFSDEAMKERDPWLWFEYVGKRAGEEKPAPKQAVEEVPGSTSVGTYLQESLGFLSQRQPNGAWPTGLPATAAPAAAGPGGRIGAGSSLGMAFLSGVCADAGARDVGAGESVDCSDVPAASSTQAAATGFPGVSSGVPAGQELRPSVDDMETSTAAVIAAVGTIGLRDDSNDDSEDAGRNARRVRFVDERYLRSDTEGQPGGDGHIAGSGDADEDGPDCMQEDEEDDEEEGEEEDEEEEEEDGAGREQVARILSERFLAGLEQGVDYGCVDNDERLDDLDQLSRDEQDRWFRGEGDDPMVKTDTA